MTTITLPSEIYFYQNPVDFIQTQNGSTQMNGMASELNSCRGCNKNLASDGPASQYQRQKLIQKTVRVQSSLYTMNLASLSGYQKPSSDIQLIEQAGATYIVPPRVYWNQMSDRARPANQVTKVASGSTYHTSSTRHTITRNRPGAMSPGGIGVDIKHNSYDRYLNKLKGKTPLRRGIIPPNYGAPIPFNRAFPIYGGKIVKTGIINGCDCPELTDNLNADKRIYGSPSNAIQDEILKVKYTFNVGDFIWAKKFDTDIKFYKAVITNITDGLYTIQFTDDDLIRIVTQSQLLIYFECNCENTLSLQEQLLEGLNEKNVTTELTSQNNIYCDILNAVTIQGII